MRVPGAFFNTSFEPDAVVVEFLDHLPAGLGLFGANLLNELRIFEFTSTGADDLEFVTFEVATIIRLYGVNFSSSSCARRFAAAAAAAPAAVVVAITGPLILVPLLM